MIQMKMKQLFVHTLLLVAGAPFLVRNVKSECLIDLVFVLDSSGSINYADIGNWDRVLNFTNRIVSSVAVRAPLGPNGLQVGLVVFSATARVEFRLTDYATDLVALQSRIRNVSYMGFETNLNDALYLVRTDIFLPGRGVRSNAAQIAIIVTDGVDNVPVDKTPLTLANATACKDAGITLIAVGVTDQIDIDRLKTIASSPNYFFSISDFSLLQQELADTLSSLSCPECLGGMVDLVLIIDSSGSINDADSGNWNRILDFCKTLVGSIGVGPSAAQVAAVVFSETAEVKFRLNAYSNNASLQDAITNMGYVGSYTDLNTALYLVWSDIFRSGNGARNGASRIGVIITDGVDNIPVVNSSLTLANATACKNAGVRLIAVGITNAIDVDRLKRIASSPSDYYSVGDFNLLNTLISSIASQLKCSITTPIPATITTTITTITTTTTPLPSPTPCVGQTMDLVLIIDSSGSINDAAPGNWNLILNFCNQLVGSLAIGPTATQVALVIFSDVANVQFPFSRYTTSESLRDAITNVGYMGSTTDLNTALYLVWSNVFRDGNGARPGATRIGVIITDGVDNVPVENSTMTLANATTCKNAGVRLIAVGITNAIDVDRLKRIASSPTDYYSVGNFSQLNTLISSIGSQFQCSNTSSATTTQSSSATTSTTTAQPAPASCRLCNIELAFVVDASSSKSTADWNSILHYVVALVDSFTIRPDCVRVTFVRYSDYADVPIYVYYYDDRNQLDSAILRITMHQSSTADLAAGLDALRNSAFGGNLTRSGATRVAVVVTNNLPSITQRLAEAAMRAKDSGVVVVGVGISSSYDSTALSNVSSDGRLATFSVDYARLMETVDWVVGYSCINVDPPTPTTSTTTTRRRPSTPGPPLAPPTTRSNSVAQTTRVVPTVDRIWPSYGPLAGGTRVTLYGNSVNDAVAAVHFGNYSVTPDARTPGQVVFVTPPMGDTGGPLPVVFELADGTKIVTNFTFQYRPNPSVSDILPTTHLVVGGTAVTVVGTNMDSVAEPFIVVTTVIRRLSNVSAPNDTSTTNGTCHMVTDFTDGTRIQCTMPGPRLPLDFVKNCSTVDANSPGVAVCYSLDGSQRADVFVGLQLDGWNTYANISATNPRIKLQFYPEPSIQCPPSNFSYNPSVSNTLSIKGSNLLRATRAVDFSIELGDGRCQIVKLADDHVDCTLPLRRLNRAADDTQCSETQLDFKMHVGYAAYPCPCVPYVITKSNAATAVTSLTLVVASLALSLGVLSNIVSVFIAGVGLNY